VEGLNRKLNICAAINDEMEYEGGDLDIGNPWGTIIQAPQMRQCGWG